MRSKLSLTFVCQPEPAGAELCLPLHTQALNPGLDVCRAARSILSWPQRVGSISSSTNPGQPGKITSPWWANTRRGRQHRAAVTFAPGCNEVSLSPARPNSISGAPKLHSRGNPIKSICPFQYLEIINSSRLRYYKRKLLVKLFIPRSGWMQNFASTGDAERARRTFHISINSQGPRRKITGIHV